MVTPELCTIAATSKKIKIKPFDGKFDVPIEFDVKIQTFINDGQTVSSTIDCASGQIELFFFESIMQPVNLTYNYGNKKVSSRNRNKPQCLLKMGGCETPTLGSYAYTWDTSENCVLTKLLTQDARMLHYLLTTDRRENQFLLLSDFNDNNDTGKGMNTKLKKFHESDELCGKPERLCKKHFECELPSRLRNARWRITNKSLFIQRILVFD